VADEELRGRESRAKPELVQGTRIGGQKIQQHETKRNRRKNVNGGCTTKMK
jgi:hypothetical protein